MEFYLICALVGSFIYTTFLCYKIVKMKDVMAKMMDALNIAAFGLGQAEAEIQRLHRESK